LKVETRAKVFSGFFFQGQSTRAKVISQKPRTPAGSFFADISHLKRAPQTVVVASDKQQRHAVAQQNQFINEYLWTTIQQNCGLGL